MLSILTVKMVLVGGWPEQYLKQIANKLNPEWKSIKKRKPDNSAEHCVAENVKHQIFSIIAFICFQSRWDLSVTKS